MLPEGVGEIHAAVSGLYRRLIQWLIDAAYPLWATRGRDTVRGGFHERLSQRAEPLEEARRLRVQPRQIYAFSLAPSLGWRTDTSALLADGLHYLYSKYRRADGLYITLVDANGSPVDDRALLYDQAFVLLGLAGAYGDTHPSFDIGREAHRLRTMIASRYRTSAGGYATALPRVPLLQTNPHMHLLEASIAWTSASGEPEWQLLTEELVELALSRFIDRSSGALREVFDETWQPAPGVAGRIVEPGHQFEWAYLLMRCEGSRHSPSRLDAALRLLDIGERCGVQEGFAVNALLDDLSPHDAAARLWPQTERLKANAAAARIMRDRRYWIATREAATCLMQYLTTPIAGLWYDRHLPSGEFVDEPAPASSLYHIVGAAAELRSLLRDMGCNRNVAQVQTV
jgi:mannose/cellobiose epimerase-like protein (N-acyl-D-glucosamine 2-epimerase family)